MSAKLNTVCRIGKRIARPIYGESVHHLVFTHAPGVGYAVNVIACWCGGFTTGMDLCNLTGCMHKARWCGNKDNYAGRNYGMAKATQVGFTAHVDLIDLADRFVFNRALNWSPKRLPKRL